MDTDANNPADTPELASAAAPAPAEPEHVDADQSSESDTDLDTQGTDPEFEEVDVDGEKLAVPKTAAEKLRAAMLRQADYTRKTQELAQMRQQSEETFAQRESRIQAEQAQIQSVAKLLSIDDRLGQYANVDWRALSEQDPVRAQQEFFAYQQLKDARIGLVSQIQQHESQRALHERTTAERAMQQANEVLGREIKGWSPEVAKELRQIAKELGADDRELDSIRAPWIVRALHAQKQLKELTKTAAKAPAPAPAQPIRTITGGTAKAAVNPDKMSTAEWMKWREKQVARSR